MRVRSLFRGIAPLTVTASVLLTGGCAGSEGARKPPCSAPGANADLGPPALRYVHAAHPGGGSWRAGSVALVDGAGHELPDGITVDPHTTGMLYAGKPHLEPRNIGERLRAGDFLKLTPTLREAGSTTLSVPTQVIEPSMLPPTTTAPSASPTPAS
jgi:hypothetical protein